MSALAILTIPQTDEEKQLKAKFAELKLAKEKHQAEVAAAAAAAATAGVAVVDAMGTTTEAVETLPAATESGGATASTAASSSSAGPSATSGKGSKATAGSKASSASGAGRGDLSLNIPSARASGTASETTPSRAPPAPQALRTPTTASPGIAIAKSAEDQFAAAKKMLEAERLRRNSVKESGFKRSAASQRSAQLQAQQRMAEQQQREQELQQQQQFGYGSESIFGNYPSGTPPQPNYTSDRFVSDQGAAPLVSTDANSPWSTHDYPPPKRARVDEDAAAEDEPPQQPDQISNAPSTLKPSPSSAVQYPSSAYPTQSTESTDDLPEEL
ncbi:hypothetical protein CAOG_00738 [Capsaspora owczarzaki ATCC 30864]|uniref:Uncharacterized protein n=1 Tax=Capsaspora owczarzaki (strain ATCC 30864) TaxID=595528 RepID=A0A0D2X0K6_CAPO3|nr:hypothetical protein CAOG_00738 [Capsaspora owczarzaki ATCC 30864]KJE89224.1 hypothetical protein CAOG_000738 [Capsaspora owczarzaki ATCC 30864]|eukprot:XP_004365609.1 hypothetical protein CAOG_00738 [Capsaspora owczarzaki ATCC 30864]